MTALKKRNAIAFDFVLEELHVLNPVVKPMFGCHAVYVREKIVLILRKKKVSERDNGVWIATTHEHHESLKKDFLSMRSISLFGSPESGWQNLPVDDESFEDEVMKVCALIIKGDSRIGKIPKPRRKNTSNLRH